VLTQEGGIFHGEKRPRRPKRKGGLRGTGIEDTQKANGGGGRKKKKVVESALSCQTCLKGKSYQRHYLLVSNAGEER